MSETLEQIATRLIHGSTCRDKDMKLDPIELCKQVVAALGAQEPVAWKDRTYGNLHPQSFGDKTAIPLYAAPQLPSDVVIRIAEAERQNRELDILYSLEFNRNNELIRLLAEAQQQIPQREGWQLVPKDYTYAMHQAWLEGNSFDERYKAMLAAAPKPEDVK